MNTWIEEKIAEFDKMRKLTGLQQIWIQHPAGVGKYIIDWLHDALLQAEQRGEEKGKKSMMKDFIRWMRFHDEVVIVHKEDWEKYLKHLKGQS